MSPGYYGSIIGLRPEFEERYRVLHRHVFPGVLERLARSNIRNYSIFLHQHTLFSHLEHVGHDYDADMAALADDETTRGWWTLTDPMQFPLDERAPGDWWARLTVVHGDNASTPVAGAVRKAFVAPVGLPQPDSQGAADSHAHLGSGIFVFRVFRSREHAYIYLEAQETALAGIADRVARALGLAATPVEIEEVFHTKGAWRPEEAEGMAGAQGTEKAEGAELVADVRTKADRKKVFVSGCFDMLHSGHVAFLKEASRYGDVHVGIGSDETIHALKGRYTVNSQDERKYMIEALDCVTACRVNRGSGFLDFEDELRDLRPHMLIVNEDGHSPAKEALCRSLGIEYRVLQRIPSQGLPARTTTALREECSIPFRIDLAGGWLDQPFVSCHYPGPVLTISIEPTIEFNDRSGMASSTRRKAIDLWHAAIPHGEPERLARVLFSYENPPGTKEIAGSQDALGIVLPGLNRLDYNGGYWPHAIESLQDEETLSWIENRLHLVTLGPRVSSFRVLDQVRVDRQGAMALSVAAEDCWRAIRARDATAFGDAFRRSFEAQVAMFPLMVDDDIRRVIDDCRDRALGWKLSGAGGGGYLILVSKDPVPNSVGIKIRRRGTQ